MPQDVIVRIHTLARRAAANVALTFGNGYGEPIPDDDDDDNDDDYLPPDDASHDGDDSNDYNSGTDSDYPFDDGDDSADEPDDVAGVMGYLPEGANNGPNIAPQQNITTMAAEMQ